MTRESRSVGGARRLAFASLACALPAGCGNDAAKAPPPKSPVDVTVLTVKASDTPVGFDFVGQTQSSREVEIRARVDGFLDKRLYVEGDLVRTGQPLFQMDRKPFEARAAVGQRPARGAAGRARRRGRQSRAHPAARRPERGQQEGPGRRRSATSRRRARPSSRRRARCRRPSSTSATRRSASPLTGPVELRQGAGRHLRLGVEQPAHHRRAARSDLGQLLDLRERDRCAIATRRSAACCGFPPTTSSTIEVMLADGSVYPQRGRISFADPSYSKETGTFLVRSDARQSGRPAASRPVREGERARRDASEQHPRAAARRAAGREVALRLGRRTRTTRRSSAPSIVGSWQGDNWFVTDGLHAGDRIVVDGAIRVGAGAALKVARRTCRRPSSPRPRRGPRRRCRSRRSSTGGGASARRQAAAAPSAAPSAMRRPARRGHAHREGVFRPGQRRAERRGRANARAARAAARPPTRRSAPTSPASRTRPAPTPQHPAREGPRQGRARGTHRDKALAPSRRTSSRRPGHRRRRTEGSTTRRSRPDRSHTPEAGARDGAVAAAPHEHLALLHRPADLRVGRLDRHHAGRRGGDAEPARSRSTRTSRR